MKAEDIKRGINVLRTPHWISGIVSGIVGVTVTFLYIRSLGLKRDELVIVSAVFGMLPGMVLGYKYLSRVIQIGSFWLGGGIGLLIGALLTPVPAYAYGFCMFFGVGYGTARAVSIGKQLGPAGLAKWAMNGMKRSKPTSAISPFDPLRARRRPDKDEDAR